MLFSLTNPAKPLPRNCRGFGKPFFQEVAVGKAVQGEISASEGHLSRSQLSFWGLRWCWPFRTGETTFTNRAPQPSERPKWKAVEMTSLKTWKTQKWQGWPDAALAVTPPSRRPSRRLSGRTFRPVRRWGASCCHHQLSPELTGPRVPPGVPQLFWVHTLLFAKLAIISHYLTWMEICLQDVQHLLMRCSKNSE